MKEIRNKNCLIIGSISGCISATVLFMIIFGVIGFLILQSLAYIGMSLNSPKYDFFDFFHVRAIMTNSTNYTIDSKTCEREPYCNEIFCGMYKNNYTKLYLNIEQFVKSTYEFET